MFKRSQLLSLQPQLTTEMLMLVFMIAAAVAVGEGLTNIFATQYASGLNITCTFLNNVNFAQMISLVITKSQDGVDQPQASVNTSAAVRNHTRGASVEGNIYIPSAYWTENSTLSIQWKSVNETLDGTYTCRAVGLDSDFLPLTESGQLTFNWKDYDPVVNATPTHIVDGSTPHLIFECSMVNKNALNISKVDKLEIFHEINGTIQLLAYSNSTQAEITTPDNRWAVIGSYFTEDSNQIYLAIKLKYPTTKDSGTFTCDITAVTYDNGQDTVEHIEISAQVTASRYYFYICDFENGDCGLNVTTNSAEIISTIMRDNVIPHGQDNNGAYLYIELKNNQMPLKVSVETKLIPPSRRRICFKIWIRLSTTSYISVEVYIRTNGVLSRMGFYYSATGIIIGQTIQNSFFAESDPFTLLMEFEYTGFENPIISIDDFYIYDVNC